MRSLRSVGLPSATALRRLLATGFLAPAALALGACSSDGSTSPSIPSSITIQSGDNQSTVVTKAVAAPLTVNVVNKSGAPLSGIVVTWRATTTLGTLADSTSTTDASGNATMTFTAGQRAGTLNVTAGAGALTVVTFTQKIVGEAAVAFAPFAGNGAAVLVTSPITLQAKVSDKYGNGVAGVVVTWAVGTQGGVISDLTSTTDASGVAKVTYTVGSTPGTYTVNATAPSFAPITFTVTGV